MPAAASTAQAERNGNALAAPVLAEASYCSARSASRRREHREAGPVGRLHMPRRAGCRPRRAIRWAGSNAPPRRPRRYHARCWRAGRRVPGRRRDRACPDRRGRPPSPPPSCSRPRLRHDSNSASGRPSSPRPPLFAHPSANPSIRSCAIAGGETRLGGNHAERVERRIPGRLSGQRLGEVRRAHQRRAWRRYPRTGLMPWPSSCPSAMSSQARHQL